MRTVGVPTVGPMRYRLATTAAPALALTIALSACGAGDDSPSPTSTTTETTTSGSSATTAPPDGDGTTTTTTGEPDRPGSGSSNPAPDEGDLPGERVDLYPYEGAELTVVGVAVDDTLNVRAGPGTEYDAVFELAPRADGFQATGRNRTVPDGPLWVEVLIDGRTGWVSAAFVAQPGQTTDVTADLGGRPSGETMVEIGKAVAALRAPGEGQEPEVTVVAGPTVGDLGEITVDAIGYGDDALAGERLHVLAAPDASGEGFTVRTVEATALCARGVSGDGLCV